MREHEAQGVEFLLEGVELRGAIVVQPLKEQDDEEEPTSLAEVVALILSMPDAAFRHPDVVARVKQCS